VITLLPTFMAILLKFALLLFNLLLFKADIVKFVAKLIE
jgi:hypothetical protein